MQARVISICNQKGGCGKTTTAINLAAGLASLGESVLVVDLDSQCNATTGLGLSLETIETTIFDVLTEPKKHAVEDAVLLSPYENLHLLPGSIAMSTFESCMASEIGRENRLKKALQPLLALYDFILIDTPPSLGLLSVNALNASTELLITLQAHPFAFDGLHLLLDTITLVKEELNPNLAIAGLVLTMFDARTKIARDIVQKLSQIEFLKGKVLETRIRQNTKIAESSQVRQPITHCAPTSFGALDYTALSKEVLMQTKKPKSERTRYDSNRIIDVTCS